MDDIIKDIKFKDVMEDSLAVVLDYFLSNQKQFGILCNVSKVEFTPKLPENIQNSFKQFTFFVLANYTLESARVQDGRLIFEAGFGEENFASVVSMPLHAVLQVILGESMVFLNITATVDKFEGESEEVEDASVNALFSNPENQALLNKLKKK